MAPKRKLTGAQAELFAAVCHHYINEAEESDECIDAQDSDVPIFSYLGKAQRLKLVADVAVGMLCEDEPLPPETIQHNAAYRAILEILFNALEVEIDMLDDYLEVGEDLLYFDEKERSIKRTDKEIQEYDVKRTLIEHRAEKNKNKLKKGKDVGEFHVDKKKLTVDDDLMFGVLDRMKPIFEGGPVTKRERDSIRPLTQDEEDAFRWRRLCDAALQKDDTPSFPGDPFLLCNVNFDWRCQNPSKWYKALNLMLDTKLMNYGSATNRALIIGKVDYNSYADPSQLPRVKALERNINLLMKTYASSWDPKLLAIDQRRIYAVCSNEIYGGDHQKKWLLGFCKECIARGIDIKAGKNYQARLDVFRDTKDDLMDGCEYPYGSYKNEQLEMIQEDWTPKEEGPKDLGFEKRMCSGPGQDDFIPFCIKSENLQACSRCRAVLCKFLYRKTPLCRNRCQLPNSSLTFPFVPLFVSDCSRECQVADWKRGHKDVCPRLAKERKDKGKISQMAKDNM